MPGAKVANLAAEALVEAATAAGRVRAMMVEEYMETATTGAARGAKAMVRGTMEATSELQR